MKEEIKSYINQIESFLKRHDEIENEPRLVCPTCQFENSTSQNNCNHAEFDK